MDTKDNVYDLHKHRFAKKVVEDVPKMLEMLDNMTGMCYNYTEYRSIGYLLNELNKVKANLEETLKVYSREIKTDVKK